MGLNSTKMPEHTSLMERPTTSRRERLPLGANIGPPHQTVTGRLSLRVESKQAQRLTPPPCQRAGPGFESRRTIHAPNHDDHR